MHKFMSIIAGNKVYFETESLDTAVMVSSLFSLPISNDEIFHNLTWEMLLRINALWRIVGPPEINRIDVNLLCLGIIERSKYPKNVWEFTRNGRVLAMWLHHNYDSDLWNSYLHDIGPFYRTDGFTPVEGDGYTLNQKDKEALFWKLKTFLCGQDPLSRS